VAAETLRVDGAGDQLLASARFAVDENAPVRRSHEANLLAKRLDRDAFAGEHGIDTELTLKFQVLCAQAPRLHRVFEHDERAVERERLFEKVVSAELGGFDGGFNGAVAADDDDFGPRIHRKP